MVEAASCALNADGHLHVCLWSENTMIMGHFTPRRRRMNASPRYATDVLVLEALTQQITAACPSRALTPHAEKGK
jgi:hypothetical protein